MGEIVKILEVFIVQIFKLTPINFKKKEVVFSYVEIMDSEFGQVFFESILTVLRMDENHNKNRKSLLSLTKSTLAQQNPSQKIQQHYGLC